MERFSVECLCCGQNRILPAVGARVANVGDCPRCGYVGWAPSVALSEGSRRQLRERPLEQRRLHAV